MKVDKLRDFLERVAWTAIQAGAAAFATLPSDEWRTSLKIVGAAALAAAVKVVAAQNWGGTDGSAIPGGIEKPKSGPTTLHKKT